MSEGERRATKKVVHSPGLSGGHSARLFDRISAVTVLESSWVPWKGWDNLRAGRSSENSEQHPFTLPILSASLSVAYCNAFLFSAILRGFFFDLCYLIHFQLPVPPVFFFPAVILFILQLPPFLFPNSSIITAGSPLLPC